MSSKNKISIFSNLYQYFYVSIFIFIRRWIYSGSPIRFIMALAPQKDGRIIIGVKNKDNKFDIPWKESADSKYFKKKTSGAALIIGYNTWLSLRQQKVELSGRYIIVIITRPLSSSTMVLIVNAAEVGTVENPIFTMSKTTALYEAIKRSKVNHIYVAGAQLAFEIFKKDIDKFYISYIKRTLNNDSSDKIYIEAQGELVDITIAVFMKFENNYFNKGVEMYKNSYYDKITRAAKLSDKAFLAVLSNKNL